jgi:DNA-binding NarL/FixJ family response regulator
LVDDHPIWRDGLRADLEEGFAVVGEALAADEAIEIVRSTRPDLVVCDLSMPGGGGLAVVKSCSGMARIVVLTVSEAERDLLEVVAAGAVGYLVKSTPGPELRAALLRNILGKLHLSRRQELIRYALEHGIE